MIGAAAYIVLGCAAAGQQGFRVLWNPNYDFNGRDAFGDPFCPSNDSCKMGLGCPTVAGAERLDGLSRFGITANTNAAGCGVNFHARK